MGQYQTSLAEGWMSRSREEGRVLPSSCRGCRDREGRGEFSPPRAVDVENKERRGEFSPPRAMNVEIKRGGGENPLLMSRCGCRERERRGDTSSSSRRGCGEQGEEGRILPSSRRGC